MNYLVYVHECPNGKRYVGITSNSPERRWGNGSGYSTQLFGKAVKKYGWENIQHSVFASDLSESDAKSLEMDLIRMFQTDDRRYGYNITAGGDDMSHCSVLNNSNSTPISQYTLKGEHVADYPSIHEAWRQTGFNYKTIHNCLAGNRRQCFGFIWKYADEQITEADIKACESPKEKSVIQLSKTGKEINRFKSVSEAAKAMNGCKTDISRCCHGRRPSAYGFAWKYA